MSILHYLIMTGWTYAQQSHVHQKAVMHASVYTNVDMLHLCGHLLRKVWPLGSLLCDVFFCFVTFSNNTPDPGHHMGNFPIWCPGSGVVFDCMDSWSLPSSLLLTLCIRTQSLIKNILYSSRVISIFIKDHDRPKWCSVTHCHRFAYFSLTNFGWTDGFL